MPICHKRKLAFCHVPRTGGVSICDALNLEVIDKHEPASFYRENYPDYHLFATYRNYRDRIRSGLGWKIPKQRNWTGSFEELVEEIHKNDDNGLMMQPIDCFLDTYVDTLLYYPHLQNDLDNMLQKLYLPTVNLPHLNSFK